MPKGAYKRTEYHREIIRNGIKNGSVNSGRFQKGNNMSSKRKDRQPNYIKKPRYTYIKKGYGGRTRCSDETRMKLRLAKIADIGDKFRPTIGKYEPQILDKLEEYINYPILRQYKVIGYFLDGYCPSLNLAIEIDEKQHLVPEQLKKDRYREEQITHKLKCSFLRIPVGV